jgi:glycosyltransferase involved in cell wall biosynthesis
MSTSLVADAPLLSVVVPVLNEENSTPEPQRRLVGSVGSEGGRVEVVYVDDRSTDRSAKIIERSMAESPIEVVLVRLSRNFGMEIAMSAGLDHARGEYVALMHADLQDPPELLPEMLAAAQGGADVVYAQRIGRDESAVKRALATTFDELMRRIARVPYHGRRATSGRCRGAWSRRSSACPSDAASCAAWPPGSATSRSPIEYRRAGRHTGGAPRIPRSRGWRSRR